MFMKNIFIKKTCHNIAANSKLQFAKTHLSFWYSFIQHCWNLILFWQNQIEIAEIHQLFIYYALQIICDAVILFEGCRR